MTALSSQGSIKKQTKKKHAQTAGYLFANLFLVIGNSFEEFDVSCFSSLFSSFLSISNEVHFLVLCNLVCVATVSHNSPVPLILAVVVLQMLLQVMDQKLKKHDHYRSRLVRITAAKSFTTVINYLE